MEEKAVKKVQAPMSERRIYQIMIWIVFPVCGIFLVKNIISGSLVGSLTVGIAIVVLGIVLLLMRALKVADEYRQLVAAMAIAFVEFIISMNSGEYYSDDFPLMLAVIAMTALYFRPKYTLVQIGLCDFLLVLLYIIHPEKAENFSQFIMCIAIMDLAAFLIYLTIKRGRAYIAISENRAREAEQLLKSLTELGNELKINFEHSTESFATLQETRKRLDVNTAELIQGSEEVRNGAQNVVSTCEEVKEKVNTTGQQVAALTEGVHHVEDALEANQQNIEEMSQQIESVRIATKQIDKVFRSLAEHMQKIQDVTQQLDGISSSTTMLSLNASIEAARAGKNGAGFAVVASKVRDLAVDSTECSAQVAGVVDRMQLQIEETTNQLAENDRIIETSLVALKELQDGFKQLTRQFDSLYQNIESQNTNVSEVNEIFVRLHGEIDEVCQFTENNRNSVDAISDAILVYKDGVQRIVDDSRHVHNVSSSMLQISETED